MRLVASLILLAACAVADDPKRGAIEGLVLDAKSNQPIRKAVVVLRTSTPPGAGTYTNAEGKFTFPDLPPGPYLLTAEHEGYLPDADSRNLSVTVTSGVTESTVTLKLIRTAIISGRVLDADGEPAVGATIQILPARPRKDLAPITGAATDDRGEFRAFNIPPGKYRIAATYAPRADREDIKMLPTPGQPDAAPPYNYGVTFHQGTLNPADAVVVEIDAGADLHNLNIQLQRARGVSVKGTVSEVSGVAPAVLWVSLMPVDGIGQGKNDVLTPPRNTFALRNVLPGNYVLSAQAPMASAPEVSHRKIEVGSTDIDGLTLLLAPPQKVTGRLLLPEGRKMLPGLMFVLAARDQVEQQGGGMAQPSADGAFTMDNVPPGDYDIALASTSEVGDDLYVAAIRLGDDDALANGVHIGSTPPPPLTVQLKPNGGAVECVVADSQHKPIPDAEVTLLPDPPRRSQLALRSQCKSDAAGKCTILGIAPGSYHAFAFAQGAQRDFNDPDIAEAIEKFAKAIQVAEGDHLKTELQPVTEEN